MKLSEEAKAYADSIYGMAFSQCALNGEAERLQIRARATPGNPNISQMSDHFVNLTKRLVDARLDSYVQAYKQVDLLIGDADKDEIIEELKRIIRNNTIWVTTPSTLREFGLPSSPEMIPNFESYMTARFERTLGEAAVELDVARKRMVMDRKNKKTHPSIAHYNIHIDGDNFGAIQQGGKNNSQSVNINTQLNVRIQELFGLIDGATDLTALQKLKASTDLRYIQELAKLPASEENQEQARSKLDDITSILSVSADLVSLGIPIIQIVRAFFGL